MKSKTLIISLKAAVCLLCTMPGGAHAWFTAWGTDTHWDITKDVLNNHLVDPSLDLARDYPDLVNVNLATQLRNGSHTESHNIPDKDATELWAPPPNKWFYAGRTGDNQIGALASYTNYDFNGAYLRIGYELHLVQDQSVPAHQYFCVHGGAGHLIDDLEDWAELKHDYARTKTPWTFEFEHSEGTNTFQYWLSDSMDDDNTNEVAEGEADEVDKDKKPIPDGPDAYSGLTNSVWGTYGRPTWWLNLKGEKVLDEILPGRNEGKDYFSQIWGNSSIVYEQLQEAYDASLALMKERSIALPPLVPDDKTNGKPNISLKIFGPNKPVEISFVAMENRKKTVFVYVLAGTAGGIMDYNSFKVLDGEANATRDLQPWDVLPWRSQIICKWTGDTATGQIDDGNHVITMQVKDQDEKSSEKRNRTVMFDKTKPTGTITITGLPQSSNP